MYSLQLLQPVAIDLNLCSQTRGRTIRFKKTPRNLGILFTIVLLSFPTMLISKLPNFFSLFYELLEKIQLGTTRSVCIYIHTHIHAFDRLKHLSKIKVLNKNIANHYL